MERAWWKEAVVYQGGGISDLPPQLYGFQRRRDRRSARDHQ